MPQVPWPRLLNRSNSGSIVSSTDRLGRRPAGPAGAPPVDHAIAEEHGAVHQRAEDGVSGSRLPELQPMTNGPRCVPVDELDVDPVDEQRAPAELLQRTERDMGTIGRGR